MKTWKLTETQKEIGSTLEKGCRVYSAKMAQRDLDTFCPGCLLDGDTYHGYRICRDNKTVVSGYSPWVLTILAIDLSRSGSEV